MRSPAELLSGAKRLVVKVGSSLVRGGDVFRHDGLAGDLASRAGETILITSGAVALGRLAAPQIAGDDLAQRQALSAIGQPLLMARWEQALGGANARTAQVLLTPDVTDDAIRRQNARATIAEVWQAGLLPVVNENDTVATDELRYGDNDRLAAQTAALVKADLLVLLSDVEGYFTANPSVDASAEHLAVVPQEVLADPASHVPADVGMGGTGGMRSKIEAAAIAVDAGIPAIIASGGGMRPLQHLAAGESRASVALPR